MYKDIVKASSNDALMTNKQIEKDLLRIMPANACFSHLHSTGIPRLRRVMRALAWLYPDIGYVQVRITLILLYRDTNMYQLIFSFIFYCIKLLSRHGYNGSVVIIAFGRGRCILDDGNNSGRFITSLLLFFNVVG